MSGSAQRSASLAIRTPLRREDLPGLFERTCELLPIGIVQPHLEPAATERHGPADADRTGADDGGRVRVLSHAGDILARDA